MKIKCDVIMPIIFSDWGQNIELFCIWWNVIKTLLRELNWIASVTQKFYCTYQLYDKKFACFTTENATVYRFTELYCNWNIFLLVYLQMCNGT